jgi:tellurite resistance protein TerC
MARASEPTAPRKPSRWTPAAVRRRPELTALVSIAVVDVAFAADSIFAAFAVTTSALPIIAANVFAVLGLRPLFVVLSDAMDRFRFLRIGIAVLLMLIGVELAVEHFVAVPSWATLAVVGCCLGGAIVASMIEARGITMRSAARRTAITVSGFTLLIAGAAMLVLPGPGLLVIVAGLAVLAKEYAWARKPLDAMKARLDRVRRRNKTS